MDQQIESKCLDLVEAYRILSSGNKMEFSEMILATSVLLSISPSLSEVLNFPLCLSLVA